MTRISVEAQRKTRTYVEDQRNTWIPVEDQKIRRKLDVVEAQDLTEFIVSKTHCSVFICIQSNLHVHTS